MRANTNLEEPIGAAQHRRRISVGFNWRRK
jgi:hypothetical protein